MGEWLRLARTGSVVRRACRYALFVGTLLIIINHGDALLRGDLSTARVLRMLLTAIVPYVVCIDCFVGQHATGTAGVEPLADSCVG